MKHCLRLLCLSLLMAVAGIASAQNVAKVDGTEYPTLQAAFDAAVDGQTVTLLRDYNASDETMAGGTRQFVINKSITFDGDNHTLTTKQKGIGIGNVNNNVSANINVTIKDVTILNSSSGARCIDTRGKVGTLTLNGVTLSTQGGSGYTQPLTIGGSQSDAATVNITNSTIQTNDAGTAYYAIILFNPVNMTLTNSTVKGWACIYAKSPDGSAGSAGSVINIEGSTLLSCNTYSGVSNSFSTFMMEDNNVTIHVTNTNVTVKNTGDQTQSLAGYNSSSLTGTVTLGEGTNVVFQEPEGCDFVNNGANATLSITGGTYNADPTDYVAEGYTVVNNGNGTYSVQEAVGVAKIGNVKYPTLQAALDAAHEMTGDVTVTLLDDISGYSIVHQKEGLNLTILGDDKTISGQIFIDGDGRLSGTETLSIQNIKFEGSKTDFYSGTEAFILVPSTKTAGTPYYTNKYNYAHNVTVDHCSFTNTSGSFDVVGIKANSGAGLRNVVITNNTGTNLHSLAQLTGTEGGNISNNTVGNSDSFVNISGGNGDFTISGNTFTSASDDGYAVRENASSSAVLNLTNNNFTAFKAIQLGKGGSATNGTINVVSGTYVGEIGKDISASATGKIAISGGQFSALLGSGDYDEFIADGYMGMNDIYNSETAPNGVAPSDAVVMWTNSNNGKVTFYTATQAATTTSLFTGNGTYKLLNDFTRTSRMSTGIMASNVTLDLNGHTLTSTASDEAILLSRAGSASSPKICAIIDSSEEKGGKLVANTDADHAILVSGKYNEVTIGEGVTIEGNCVSLTSANQKLTVEGAVNGGNDFAIATNGSSTTNATIDIKDGAVITSNSVAIYLPSTGTTTIEEGSSITGTTGIYIKSGTLNITGGEINGNGPSAEFVHNNNGVYSTGDALVVENCSYPGGAPVVNVTGGIFTSANNVAIASYAYGDGNEAIAHFVNGGYFSTQLDEEVCPIGMRTVASSTMEGYYELAEVNYVAQIGDTKYETLADAVAAVPANGTETTIVVIADIEITGNHGVTIPTTKNVKLDLNGKSVTLKVAASSGSELILNQGTLTIVDTSTEQTGVLTNIADESLAVGSWPSSNYVTNIITNCGTLNVNGGNIVSTANGSICYAVDNNSTSYDATANINGGRLTSVGTVIRQFCNSTTKQNVLNITGGVVETNGYAAIWTQLPGSTSTSKKLATLNITGGVVKGGSYAWYDYSFGDSF